MIDSLVTGLSALFTGWTPLYLVAGVALGLVVGVLPALGATAGMSLLLPFVFGLDPTAALALMIGMLATVATGDTVTSIVLGVPGSASSQATILDGFPLAKRGEAGRALSAAYFASMLGGVFGAIVLTGVLLVAKEIILYFGLPEMLMLVVFGLTSVAALSGRSVAKGLSACALGLVVGSVGAAPATGEYRLDFGVYHFGDGISLVACVLGVFVIPEIVDLLRTRSSISDRPLLNRGGRQGIHDVIENRWLVLRSSGLGCLIGSLPGIGGAVVDWLAYGHAVRSAKDKSRFGKGDIRGVIAVEGSNNAVLGGALLPTLLFGVPGSGSMALFLSGLILIGVQPGPAMVKGNLDLTYSIVWALALANILGTLACYFLSGTFARLTQIPFNWLAPFLLLVVCFAVLQVSRAPLDLAVLGGFGLAGILLRRFSYSRPAFLIGFVLQDNLEVFLYQSAQIYDLWSFFSRPIVIAIALVTLLTLAQTFWRKDRLDTEGVAEHEAAMSTRRAQLAVPTLLAATFAVAIVSLQSFATLGKLFPIAAASIGLLATGVVALGLLRRSPSAIADGEAGRPEGYPGMGRPILWLAGGIALIWILGFLVGGAAFLAVFLLAQARAQVWSAAIATAASLTVFWTLADLAALNLPVGAIAQLALN